MIDKTSSYAEALNAEDPAIYPASPLAASVSGAPRMKSRWIMPPAAEGWTNFVLSEWELRAAGWTDYHPHDETNVVIEGELHVESGGTTVVLRPGDTARVLAGQVGSYWAPVYARMIGVYGPNPSGAESDYVRYWEIDSAS